MSRFGTLLHAFEGRSEEEKALRRQVLAEQKRAEEAQARLAAIVESSEDAILSKSPEGVITSWNAAAERLLGYRADEAVGRPITLIVPPEQQPEEAHILERFCHGERLEHYETVRRAKDGRRIEVSLTISPIRDQTGRVIGASTIMRDITQCKQTEEALRQSEAYFRQLTNTMPQIVWGARPDGLLNHFNERWCEFTGFAAGADGANGWQSVLHPEDVEPCLRAWRTAVESGRPFQAECRLKDRRTGQYRWFLARALPVRNPQGELIRWFGTSTDIEDQKRAEVSMAEARHHLEQVVQARTAELRSSVAELEAFCYSLSHDMRAPLRAIISYIQLVLQRCGARIGPSEQEFLKKSLSSAQRMDHLIQDVLAFSRLSRQEVNLHAVDVERLAREIIQERPELQPPQAEVRLEGSLRPMRGHEALLTQCLTNLLANAVKFVARGVKPQVRLYSQVLGEQVRLWVEDNGIGIRRDEQQKLFRLFLRLHRDTDYEGTGVGLAIVRRAVERMGGEVGVESQPGKGSRFWVELPLPRS